MMWMLRYKAFLRCSKVQDTNIPENVSRALWGITPIILDTIRRAVTDS